LAPALALVLALALDPEFEPDCPLELAALAESAPAGLLDWAPLEAELELELELELDPALELELELDLEADDGLEDDVELEDDELGVDEAGGAGGDGIDGGVGGLLAQPAASSATVDRISAPRINSGPLGTQVGASQEMVELTSQSGAGRVLDRRHERQRNDGADDHWIAADVRTDGAQRNATL
jgi:hypothetical protein